MDFNRIRSDDDSGRDASLPESGGEEDPPVPKLGVHVLTEFMFCPSAGVLEYEREREDTGEEADRVARLDYLPDYTIPLIQAEIDRIWSQLLGVATWAIPAIGVLVGIAFFLDVMTAIILGVAAMTALGPWSWRLFRMNLTLRRKRQRAESAAANEPREDLAAVQQVNWWQLLKAGFDPVERREALFDPGLRIAGKPRMVLRRGATCIPVFRKRRGDRELYPQHHARLAAYAHLLKTFEQVQVPYGVIMFGDSEEGVAVPITEYAVRVFEQGLADALRLVSTLARQPVVPDRPARLSLCAKCHLGRPRLYRPGKSETVLRGAVLEPFLTMARQTKKKYHSDCGDRYGQFGWVPPHELAQAMGLTD